MPLPKEHTYTIKDIYALPEGERAELIDGQIYMMGHRLICIRRFPWSFLLLSGIIFAAEKVPVRFCRPHWLSHFFPNIVTRKTLRQ